MSTPGQGGDSMDVLLGDTEVTFLGQRSKPRPRSNPEEGPRLSPEQQMNTIAVNVKVSRELLEQAQASLDQVEQQLRPSLNTSVCDVVGPPSVHYSLFKDTESDWAQSLERQLQTRRWALLEEGELSAALSAFPLHSTQTDTEESEGPSQYLSARDLSPTPSSNNSQELKPRGVETMDTNSSCPSAVSDREDSEDDAPQDYCTPCSQLPLLMDVAELSSITHSPAHPQNKLSMFSRGALVPCNSTPRNPGVQQRIPEGHVVCSLTTSLCPDSHSFCTAVDEPTTFTAELDQPSPDPEEQGAEEEPEEQGCEGEEPMEDVEHVELQEDCEADMDQGTAGTGEPDDGQGQGQTEEKEHDLSPSLLNKISRAHSTLDNMLQDIEEEAPDTPDKDYITEEEEDLEEQGSGEDVPRRPPPSVDQAEGHEQPSPVDQRHGEDRGEPVEGEEECASLLHCYRAHSTLDEELQALVLD